MTEEPIPPQALLKQAEFVRTLARSLLKDEHLADDVAQDTWVAAIERAPSQVVNLRAWLATVVRNFVTRRHRGESRRKHRERECARFEVVEASELDESHAAASESILRSVTNAVLALDEPYRSTVLLRYFEGLEPGAIAARQGVSIATVRSRLQRALVQLRARLDREHGDRSAWGAVLAPIAREAPHRVPRVGAAPSSPSASLASAASIASTGVVLMSAKLKLAFVASALILGWMLWDKPWRANRALPEVAETTAPSRELQREDPSSSGQDVDAISDRARIAARSEGPESRLAAMDAHGSIVVHATYKRTGLPAADIQLKLLVWGEYEPFLAPIRGSTDANGDYRCDLIHAGNVALDEQHGAGCSTQVVAGEETNVELCIPIGIRVQGRVLDGDDVPISDADIWVSEGENFQEWTRVARSGRDGTFELEDMGKSVCVSARHARFGPSSIARIDGEPGGTCAIRLVLEGEAGRVEGRVVDAQGSPVKSARVRIDDAHSGRGMFGKTVNDFTGTSVPELSTDESGRFQFDGVLPPSCSVSVRAARFAPFSTSVPLEKDGTARVDVVLQPGVRVHGVAHTDAGAPASGISIGVGSYGSFLSSHTKTASDGSFHLDSLGDGRIKITAWKPKLIKVERTLTAKPGDDLEWNPVLAPAAEMHGRIVDEQGAPLASWGVGASAFDPIRHENFQSDARTDAEGRFVINNCPAVPMRLEISQSWESLPVFALEDVRKSPEEFVVRVPDGARLSAGIRGVLIDADGNSPGGNVFVQDSRFARTCMAKVALDSGAFRQDALPPGHYALQARDKEGVVHELGKRDLASGQTLDLGNIVLERPGHLVLVFKNAEGFDRREFLFLARPADRGRVVWGGDWPGDKIPDKYPLAPDDYRLCISGGDQVASERVDFKIRTGEDTVIQYEPKRGVARSFKIVTASSVSGARVLVEALDASGKVVAENDLDNGTTLMYANFMLAAGDYTLRATAHDGRRTEIRIHVDLTESSAVPEIDLR
jgi:RNA polymerase sigma-70 factor (ECF subfamily)